jgi:hypothetical protein
MRRDLKSLNPTPPCYKKAVSLIMKSFEKDVQPDSNLMPSCPVQDLVHPRDSG